MYLRACALALWCAALVAGAAAAAADCDPNAPDCDRDGNNASDTKAIPFLPTVIPTSSSEKIETTTNDNENKAKDVEKPTVVDKLETEVKPKGRLLNLNVDEIQNFANTLQNHTQGKVNKKPLTDLSDINMDDDVEETPGMTVHHDENTKVPNNFYPKLEDPYNPLFTMMSPEEETCHENGIPYSPGEHIVRGCEELCECTRSGKFECSPRCKHPYIRRGRRLDDPLCFESPIDDCCSIIACATGNGENKPTKLEVCRYGNDTHQVGASWDVGCDQKCSCEPNSVINCKPRCKLLKPSEKCINVQDPNDTCCEVQICDVSQDVHEEHIENVTSSSTSSTTEAVEVYEDRSASKSTSRPLVLIEPIESIKILQNNTVQVNLMYPNSSRSPVHLQLSDDGGKSFKDVELKFPSLLDDLQEGKDYVLKTKETGTFFNFTLPGNLNETDVAPVTEDARVGCHHDGKFYAVGEEFHIDCTELCECSGPETKECVELVCPNHVGLELVSKGCVQWAPNPPLEPPNCCPRTARCLSDGTCHYKDIAIPNWSEVPISLTGCEQRCFCENGELDCQEVCTSLPAVPPQNLRCPPMYHPAPVNASEDDCCKKWGCIPNKGYTPSSVPDLTNTSPPQSFIPTIPPNIHFPGEEIPEYDENLHRPGNSLVPNIPNLPPGIHLPPNYGEENKKLSVISIQADSPTSVKLLFGLPPVLVGLRGSVDLRYTDTSEDDISHWYSQVFAPADEVLTTPRLEFRLTGLKPSTMYRIKGKLYLHNLPVEPQSDVYSVRTLDLPTVTPIEEKRKEIDSRLAVVDVNDTVAHVSWRHFTEDELQFVDGIQVRYRPVGTPIYSMTELLHHSRSIAELHELRPGTRYEASLVLIPPPRATTELIDPGVVEFTTAPYVDLYNWSVTIEAQTIGSNAAEITWSGVPSPAERWVRVYRAAHACGASRKEHDAFRLATRDLPPTILLSGLESDARCRIWLELFLTNGKIKTSNVLEISTKSEDTPSNIDNEIEASSIAGSRGTNARGDYYGALVVVGVVAALGALTSLLLLLVLVRRHRPRSVPITPVPSGPRDSTLPPYDNPAYKLELQQETMDL